MVKSKKQSKRVSLSRRYNIAAKVKEHDRKAKRDAKKNPHLRKKLTKDPGIPNMNPFKAQILQRLAEQQKLLKFQQAQSTRRSQEVAAKRKLGAGTGLAGMAAHAAARGSKFSEGADAAGDDAAVTEHGSSASHAGEQTRRAFYRHVKALMEKADILLEVLDARDPLGCRATAVEALALSQSPPKKIILVLNKIDLVPPAVAARWLAYLRREFPTVAFKASTQQQRDHLAARGGAAVNKAAEAGEVITGSGAAGTDTLLQLIKNYSRSHDIKTAVTVGIIGYPNVGKSSVINSLKRSRAVGVSPIAGFTRTLQEVSLDSKVTLIDSPGIIFEDDAAPAASSSSSSEPAKSASGSLVLRNCVSVESIADPEGVVADILSRCSPAKLMAVYGIAAFTDAPGFLRAVAQKRGKVGKGGVPDLESTARIVLADWNSGRIPFYVLPPDGLADGGAADGEDAEMKGSSDAAATAAASASSIVQDFGKELDLVALLAAADRALLGGTSTPASASAAGISLGASAPLPRGAQAKTAAARLAAGIAAIAEEGEEEEGDDEDEEGDDEEMGEGEGDDDDDDNDDDDDEEEDDEEEMEEEVPAAVAVSGAAKRAGTVRPRPSSSSSSAAAEPAAPAHRSSAPAGPAAGLGAKAGSKGKAAAAAGASAKAAVGKSSGKASAPASAPAGRKGKGAAAGDDAPYQFNEYFK